MRRQLCDNHQRDARLSSNMIVSSRSMRFIGALHTYSRHVLPLPATTASKTIAAKATNIQDGRTFGKQEAAALDSATTQAAGRVTKDSQAAKAQVQEVSRAPLKSSKAWN